MSRDLTVFLNKNTAILTSPQNPEVNDYFYILRNGSTWNYCDQYGGLIASDYMYASGYANSDDGNISIYSYVNSDAFTSEYFHPNGGNYTGTLITTPNNTTFYNTIVNHYDSVYYNIDYTTSTVYYKITLQTVATPQTKLYPFFSVDIISLSGGGGGSGGTTSNGGNQACFSLQSALKLIATLPKNKFYLMTRMKRENKKMYSIEYGTWGQLDFTHDHQFIYKNQVYTFEELKYIHPVFKRATYKSSNPDEYIYNIYGSYDEKYVNNMIELGPQLIMMGGKLYNDSSEYFAEVKEKIKNIYDTNDIINFTIDKFINSGINTEMVHLVYIK
jgi:hypothetical protein